MTNLIPVEEKQLLRKAVESNLGSNKFYYLKAL